MLNISLVYPISKSGWRKWVKLLICLVVQYPLIAQQGMDSLRSEFHSGSPPHQVKAALAISKYYLNINIDSAGWYALRALRLADEIGDDNLLYKAYLAVGSHKLVNSSFNEALDYFLKAEEIIEGQTPMDSVSLLRVYANTAIVYERQEDLKNSYHYSEKAIGLLSHTKNSQLTSLSGAVYSGLANTLFRLRDTTKGIEYQQKGLAQAFRVGNYPQASILLNNLGNIFLTKHKYDKAYQYMLEGKKIRQRINDQRGLSSSYRNLSNYFKETKQYDSAKFYAKQTLSSLHKVKGTLEIYSDIYYVLSEIYQGQAKFDSALSAYRTYTLYKDSLLSSEKFKELARVEAQHEVLRKTAADREEARINRIRTFIAIGALLAIVIILFLLSTVQKDRAKLREEKLLSDQNKLKLELDYKNKDLATLGLFLIKKDEFISEVIPTLTELKNAIPAENHKTIIKIARDLNSILGGKDNSWKEFELRFREVHQGFFDTLESRYPGLTSNERRLCALLKLEMSTKEISSITNQTPRSLEVARSRLRKKFNLTNSEITLTDFLAKLSR